MKIVTTFSDGTSVESEPVCIQGVNGDPGELGKTPVKGEDYYTEADKTEMVNAVLAALPEWTGGEY